MRGIPMLVVGALAVAMVGCASGPPSAEEMGKVWAVATPNMMTQFGAMAGGAVDMPTNQQQATEAMLRPLYQAADRCGMSHQQCKAGYERMHEDPSYKEAVVRAAGMVMMQQMGGQR